MSKIYIIEHISNEKIIEALNLLNAMGIDNVTDLEKYPKELPVGHEFYETEEDTLGEYY
jgi:hypothetical protein